MNTKPRPYLYFAYGSNLHLEQMGRRCPNAIPMQRYRLKGYRLVFRGVADVVTCPKKSVQGALYVITEHCEAALDRYEGFPHLYTKKFIQDPELGTIMFYQMTSRHYIAPPTHGYFQIIVEGYKNWGIKSTALDAALPEGCNPANIQDEWVRPRPLVLDVRDVDWHSWVYGGKRKH